jgi:hypothetical protein
MLNKESAYIKTGEYKPVVDFTMGADPEFLVVDKKVVVKGNEILKEGDDFGVDGNGVLFEIRPEPSTSPLEVTNNVRQAMVRQCIKNPKFLDFDWYAGSFQRDFGIGGHIHFGIKDNLIDFPNASNILAQYVGAASILLEDREQGLCRRKWKNGQYGHHIDFRPQPYGFEYRCPSSWITDPKVSAAIMCLAKVVMFEALNNNKFKVVNRIKKNHVQEMLTDEVRSFWPDIWNDITKMSLYPHYKSYLDLIYFMIKRRRNWFPNCSLKEAWGIVDLTAFQTSPLKLQAIWQKFPKNEMSIVQS